MNPTKIPTGLIFSNLGQWFSTMGSFAPERTFDNLMFGRGECYWLLVGGARDAAINILQGQDSTHSKMLITLRLRNPETEELILKSLVWGGERLNK